MSPAIAPVPTNGNGGSGAGGGASAIPAPPPASPRFAQAAFERLRERSRRLGLAVWRCDNSGLVLTEPEEQGPAGLLFQAPTFLRLVSEAVRGWAAQDEPGVTGVFDGCWAIPMAERRRRQRTGFTVLLGFGPECFEAAEFRRACQETQLDAKAVARSMRARATFNAASCQSTRDLMTWMVQDLGQLAELEQTTSGFTRQLTDSYETIDLLYALGRSMNDLTKPEKFIRRLCERVKFALGFGWVCVWTAPEAPGEGAGAPEQLLKAGEPEMPENQLLAGIRSELAAAGPDGLRIILTELNGQPLPNSGQALMQPIIRGGRARAAILAGDKQGDDPQLSGYDIQLLEAAAGFIGAFLDNAALYAEQQAMFLGTLEALTESIDAKDRYTCGHSQRVAHLAQQLALAAGLSTEQAERVRIAGLVHDVGKIGVPEAVLCKAGRLSDEEFEAIKRHPEIGHRILRDIPKLADVLPGVLHHHERYDGRGYPHGLRGEQIPLFGRLIAIADTFDAMSSTRSYRSALPRETVLAELQKSAGSQLDPKLVPLFLKLDLGEYDRMVARHAAGVDGVVEGVRLAA